MGKVRGQLRLASDQKVGDDLFYPFCTKYLTEFFDKFIFVLDFDIMRFIVSHLFHYILILYREFQQIDFISR